MEQFFTVLVFGIMLGGIYGLVSIGLNLIFGVVRIVNFAQGELVMFGMYGAYAAWHWWGISPYLSVFIVAPLVGLLGIAIQRLVIQPQRWAQAAADRMTDAECVEVYWYVDSIYRSLCVPIVDAEGTEVAGAMGRVRASNYLRAFADELLYAVGRRRSQSAQGALIDVLFDRRCRFDPWIAEAITRAFLSLGVTTLPALKTAPDYAKDRASVIEWQIWLFGGHSRSRRFQISRTVLP